MDSVSLLHRTVSAGRRIRRTPRSVDTGGRGASAVDYGLLVAGVAILILVVIIAFGSDISRLLD